MAGHLLGGTTWVHVKKKFHNISEGLCDMFCATCPVCLTAKQKKQVHKGAKKAIHSSCFRDRFQCDLVDFSEKPAIDGHGVECKFLMVLKDHFARFVCMRAIPSKHAQHVAYELSNLFGMIGYPVTYHSDNGGEVHSKEVLKIVRELHPHCTTVTGRPREPRDQGSVERANQVIKKIFSNFEEEERLAGRVPNWTFLVGRVMAAINSSASKGRDNQSPYSIVFGMDFYAPCPISTDVLRTAETVEDISKLMCSPSFDARMRSCGYLTQDARVDADADHEDVKEAVRELFGPNNEEGNAKEQESEQDSKPPAMPSLPVRTWDTIVTQSKKRVGIFHALHKKVNVRTLLDKRVHSFVYPRLEKMQLSIGDAGYYKANMFTNRWWESELVSTFLIIKAHRRPNPKVMLVECHMPNTAHDLLVSQLQAVPEGVEDLVCVGYSENHFAMLEFNLPTKRVKVRDGFGYGISHWISHVNYVLHKYILEHSFNSLGPNGTSSSSDWSASIDVSVRQKDAYNCGPIACMLGWQKLDPDLCPAFSYKDVHKFREWIIKDLLSSIEALLPELTVTAAATVIEIVEDSTDNIPLAPGMESFCHSCNENFDASSTGTTFQPCGHSFHNNCVETWQRENHVLKACPICKCEPLKCEDIALTPMKKPPPVAIRSSSGVSIGASSILSTSKLPKTEAEIVIQDRFHQRAASEEKRRRAQDAQAIQMEKRYKKHHAVKVGDIVSIQVKPNERSQASPREPVGVVYKTTKLESAYVCTEWGRIASGNGMQVYPIDGDRLTVQNQYATVSVGLLPVIKQVRERTFDENDHGKVTIGQAQQRMLQHDIIPRGRCGCKKKCGKSCGCVRQKIHCTSSCKCFGKCDNPHNID